MKTLIPKITNFLAQPYPFYYQGKSLWVIAGLIFFMTLFFGFLFEPFGVYVPEQKMHYFWISLIHACVTLFIIAFFPLFNKSSFLEDHWTIQKETILIALFLMAVGIAQFLIRDIIYDNPNNWSWPYFYEEIRNTFLIGTLFSFILISLNFNRLNARNRRNANTVNTAKTNVISTSNNQTKSDDLGFDVEHFLFALAQGNYTELFFSDKHKVLKRTTIKDLETLLKPYSHIIKTHRSYLVNVNQIENVTGNAQGYKLALKNHSEKLPVSRNMIAEFNARMKNG